MFTSLAVFARPLRKMLTLRRATRDVTREALRAVVQALEGRRLLSMCSGGANFTFDGDAGGNIIQASTSGGTLTVSSGSTSCNWTENQVMTLTITGGSGNDVITIATSVVPGWVTLP